jgi:DNA replication protein DnaC
LYFPEAKVIHLHGASGNFKSHLDSPLAKSAIKYHGRTYFFILNFILRLGQKWQKIINYNLK